MAYWTSVVIGAIGSIALCAAARRWPGHWRLLAARFIGTALAAVAVSFTVALLVDGRWSATTSLPLPLCDAAVVVAAVACWWRTPLCVELTYFWGLAGTLQGVLTPDLSARFPALGFFQYVVGHIGIVAAALFLVAGMGIVPRRRAVPRVFAVTACYTAFVGVVDAATGANYMFLRRPPGEWTALRLLGPWPWYVLSAAAVAVVLMMALDAPFWRARARRGAAA